MALRNKELLHSDTEKALWIIHFLYRVVELPTKTPDP